MKIEEDIHDSYNRSVLGILSDEYTKRVDISEKKKVWILKFEENSWRLVSREIWLKQWDINIKFFHKIGDQRNLTLMLHGA